MQIKSWSRYLSRAGQMIGGYLAFLIGTWTFLSRAGQEPVLGTVAALATAGLCWSYILICLFERRPTSTLDVTGRPGRAFRFSGHRRYGLIASAIGLPAIICFGLFKQSRPALDSNSTLILVAGFDGPDEKYGVTEAVFEELRRLERTDPQLRVRSAGVTISPKNGPALAQKVAEDHGAAVIIWGWYRATERGVTLNAHYHVVQDSCASYFVPPERKIVADVKELSCFTVQTQLSSELAVLSQITAGLAHLSQDQNEEAYRHFSGAFGRSRASPELLSAAVRARLAHLAGYTSWVDRRLDTAQLYFDSAVALDSTRWRSHVGRAMVSADQAEFVSAIAYVNDAIRISENNPEAVGSRGEIRRRAGSFSLARADLDYAATVRPDLWYFFSERAKLESALGNYRLAEADFTRAIELLAPASACRNHLLNERGRARFSLYNADPTGRRSLLELAAADFSEALEGARPSSVARHNRGLAFHRLGYLRRAYVDYTTHLRTNPRDYQTRLERGRLLLENLSDPVASIEDFEAAIAIDARQGDAYYYRGIALIQLGDAERARQDLEEVIRIAPKHALAPHAEWWIGQLRSQMRSRPDRTAAR